MKMLQTSHNMCEHLTHIHPLKTYVYTPFASQCTVYMFWQPSTLAGRCQLSEYINFALATRTIYNLRFSIAVDSANVCVCRKTNAHLIDDRSRLLGHVLLMVARRHRTEARRRVAAGRVRPVRRNVTARLVQQRELGVRQRVERRLEGRLVRADRWQRRFGSANTDYGPTFVIVIHDREQFSPARYCGGVFLEVDGRRSDDLPVWHAVAARWTGILRRQQVDLRLVWRNGGRTARGVRADVAGRVQFAVTVRGRSSTTLDKLVYVVRHFPHTVARRSEWS